MLSSTLPDGNVLYGEQESLTLNESIHRYTGHKDDGIDLACLDLRGIKTKQYDVPALPMNFLEELDESRIGVGSDVLYAGFPNGMKDEINGLALMRKGSIASIPSMDCGGRGCIAIDGTVQFGNSGGPVFVDYGNEYRLLGVMHAKSNMADDYGFVIKQKYVNELIEAAVDKSANELREIVKDIIMKELEGGQIEPEIQRIKVEQWKKISLQLDNVRNRG